MRFYNTLTRGIDEFEPMESGKVRMYTCGPTVYDFAHIGNFRAYIFEDILRRHLEFSGYDVTQVMNLTDVDDKTIKGAIKNCESLDEYTRKYKSAFFEDLDRLNIERAEYYPAATDHIDDMIKIIEKLFEYGYAYKSDDGSVYFDVSRFSDYGKLAHLDISGLKAGARVAQDEYGKDSVADFALWKAWDKADGNVKWASPWGEGRPGWHIECSAMSAHYLGESFDIHTGGVDNIFPHHENEIAQSEAATGMKFVRYWLHCGHLVVEGRKMSKSSGNFYTLRQILDKGYSGSEVRYVLLSGHYRQQLNFTFEACEAARSAIRRINEFSDRLSSIVKGDEGTDLKGDAPDWAKRGLAGFCAGLDDDLNMPEAQGSLFEMIREGNRAITEGAVDGNHAAHVLAYMDSINQVLGLKKDSSGIPAEVTELAAQRDLARQNRDWAQADTIRDTLISMGWEVKDTKDGARLKRMDK